MIRLSPTGKGMDGKPQYVNPMDINLNYSEDDNPLALKMCIRDSYCRLSKDDDLQGESASIANQRDMLEKYCEKQGWEVVAVYQDRCV